MLALALFLFVAVPISWLVSEFWNHRSLRIILGIAAIATTTFCVCETRCMLDRISYNECFSRATKNLVQTSIEQIEAGHSDRVLKVWRDVNARYYPSYEEPPAGYVKLVETATAQMKGDVPIESRKE